MANDNISTIDSPKSISLLKAWLLASRPKTLPVSLPPIIVGAALAAKHVEVLNWVLIGFALICTLAIQIGTNLVNDALDFKRGADTAERLGPQRMTQGGFLTYKKVLAAGCLCYGLALICGIPLMLAGGLPIFFILCLSVACGYLYTGGPYPLAYTGLSDFFVLIFFGWVSTGIVYYLQTATVSSSCFLGATQIGLLAIVPHAINNLRDNREDAHVQKRTLAVRFGIRFARYEIAVFSFAPFLLGLLWIKNEFFFMAFLPFFCLPIVMRNVKAIWLTEPSQIYNEFLAKSALCELIFGFLLALGIILE